MRIRVAQKTVYRRRRLDASSLLNAPAVLDKLYGSGDTDLDGWTDQGGGSTNIYQTIDEAVVNDSDYVQSPSIASATADLKVRLFEGSTQIAEWVHSNISATFTTTEQTLTGPQYAAISNFSNLFVEFDDNQGAVYRFPVSDPVGYFLEPMKVRYRYKKLAG